MHVNHRHFTSYVWLDDEETIGVQILQSETDKLVFYSRLMWRQNKQIKLVHGLEFEHKEKEDFFKNTSKIEKYVLDYMKKSKLKVMQILFIMKDFK